MRPKTRSPLLPAATIRLLALLLSLSAITACGADGEADAPLAALVKTLVFPPLAGRLSIATSFRACPEAVPDGGTVVRARCPALPPRTVVRLADVAVRARAAGDDPAAMHTLALVDLAAEDSSGRALERAISTLRQVAAVSDRPGPALADLAAALIARAERTQAPRDLLEAYETAEQSLRHEARNPAALYNRALALDRFGLVDETARDWQAYLAADSTSAWADEARRRRQAVLAIRAPAPPAADAPLAAYAAYAAADPQGARELGMDVLLGEWGEAVEAGDAPRAAERLGRAATLADALERRPGGDASLADMVRAIRAAAASPRSTHALACAHHEYAAGVRLFDSLDYAKAQPRFAAAAAAAASPALAGWARVFRGTTEVQLGAREAGERLLTDAASADTLRHPALVARARWSLGRTAFANERWEHALNGTRQSARLFARVGEQENEGAALTLAGDIHFLLGEPDSGYAVMHRGHQRLRPYRTSLRLHNLLAASADAIAADGLHASALRLLGEDVSVAARTGHPAFAAEARLKRARHLARSGDWTRSQADLEPARALVQEIDSKRARNWFATDLREVQAVLSLRDDPGGATRELDSAAAYYARIRFPFRVLPALVGSAEARLFAGDPAGALQRLESAVRLLDQRRDSIGMEPRRAAVFDAARGVVDRLVLLKLAEGRSDEALRYMDRARASLSSASPGRRASAEFGALEHETAVEYARIADTLLVWTVSSGRVQAFRTVIDTIQLTRTIREVENRLQRGASEAEVRASLALLYDWLIRPVEGRLGIDVPLVVVADGEIAAVPFAALYDARRRRYLMEDRSVRFAVSLREAQRIPTTNAADGVVLVADPAHDRREHPLLERLAHAREEVRMIGPRYRGAAMLEGAQATRSALEAALARSGVVHFAGHAVFDDQRPERSYLVLAPAPGGRGGGRITAAELARLDLRRVRLVVLSACRTVRSGNSRAGGFTGLAGALLAAGAGGAVGSTWEVDDRATAALMAQFHRAYAQGSDGPGALREAQLALLRSDDPKLRTPAAWAGFRYAGR